MLTAKEAKDIAGKKFVQLFGQDFVRKNLKKLGTCCSVKGDYYSVLFTLAERDIDTYPDLFHMEGEEHFPDDLCRIEVSLLDGAVVIKQ